MKQPSECTEEEYLAFYRGMYPFDPDPIFWVHLNVDYPFHLKGILYFPKITKRFDYQQSNIHLYCNRVFVSDNCKDLIPDYLMVLRGAMDSPDIPLNVSRSYLQMDKTVRALSSHISKKVSDRLSFFHTSDKEKFTTTWSDIETVIKLGCLQDEKFYEKVKSFLVWKTTQGEFLTVEEYHERYKDRLQKAVYYTMHEKQTSHFLHLFNEKGIEVLIAGGPLDTPLMNLLESKNGDVQFKRIDPGLDESFLDKEKEKGLLDAEGKSESVRIAECIRHHLSQHNIDVEAQSLASNKIPGFLMIDEASRRMRDYLSISQADMLDNYPGKRTFIINTNNPLIMATYRLNEKKPELAKDLTHQIYELSLLGQRELKSEHLSEFIERSNLLLEKLTQELAL